MSSREGKAFQEGTTRTKALRHEQLGMSVEQQENRGVGWGWSTEKAGASGGERLEGEKGARSRRAHGPL